MWFDCLNNFDIINEKMDGSVHDEKSHLRILELSLSLNWIVIVTLPLSLKLLPQKLEPRAV